MKKNEIPQEALEMLSDNRGDEDEQLDTDFACEDFPEPKLAEDAVG